MKNTEYGEVITAVTVNVYVQRCGVDSTYVPSNGVLNRVYKVMLYTAAI